MFVPLSLFISTFHLKGQIGELYIHMPVPFASQESLVVNNINSRVLLSLEHRSDSFSWKFDVFKLAYNPSNSCFSG